jgi:ankyrin repeat protein
VRGDRRQEKKDRAAAKAEEARQLLSPEAAAKVPQLLDAARRGDTAALAALTAEVDPPSLDAQDPVTLRTPLMEATDAGQEAMVEWLMERGVKVKLRDAEGCTALIHGAGRRSVKVVRLLLGRSQNINAQDYAGWTALMHAAAGNHRKVVKALLAGGDKADAVCDEGKTAEELTTCPLIKGLLRVSQPLAPVSLL